MPYYNLDSVNQNPDSLCLGNQDGTLLPVQDLNLCHMEQYYEVLAAH